MYYKMKVLDLSGCFIKKKINITQNLFFFFFALFSQLCWISHLVPQLCKALSTLLQSHQLVSCHSLFIHHHFSLVIFSLYFLIHLFPYPLPRIVSPHSITEPFQSLNGLFLLPTIRLLVDKQFSEPFFFLYCEFCIAI